jgi:hypothetical protein
LLSNSCEWLHDHKCDGKAWRFCGAEEQLETNEGDKEACIRVLDTSVHAISWSEGAPVSNGHYEANCNTEFTGTLKKAQAKCAKDIECEWLHDRGCDGKDWRFCNGKAAIAATPANEHLRACTMVVDDVAWHRRTCSVSCKFETNILKVEHDTTTSHKTHRCFRDTDSADDCKCLCEY